MIKMDTCSFENAQNSSDQEASTATAAKMKPPGQKSEPATYPFDMDYLPPEFVKKAKIELFETPEEKKIQIGLVRNLLHKEKNIDEEWFKEEVITMYLRGRKYKAEETFFSMKRTISFIKKHPHLFQPIDPDDLKDFIRVSPVRDENGCLIFIAQLTKWNTSKVSFEDALRYTITKVFSNATNNMSQVNGVVIVYDFQHQALRYARHFTPLNAYLVHQLLIDCLPIRIKGIHLVNPPFLLGKLAMSLLHAVGSEKLKKRFFCHSKSEDVLYHVQANVLPKEYGGKVLDEEIAKVNRDKMFIMPNYVTSVLENL